MLSSRRMLDRFTGRGASTTARPTSSRARGDVKSDATAVHPKRRNPDDAPEPKSGATREASAHRTRCCDLRAGRGWNGCCHDGFPVALKALEEAASPTTRTRIG